MKQICNKMFTRMIIVFLFSYVCFVWLSLEMHAIPFRLPEAELSIDLIP